MTPTETQTLTEALEHFGIRNQVSKTIEELSELIRALARWQIKYIEKPKYWKDHATTNIAEEIADVQIMLSQLQMNFKYLTEESDKIKHQKIDRLSKLIKARQNPGPTEPKQPRSSFAAYRGTIRKSPEPGKYFDQIRKQRTDFILSNIPKDGTYTGAIHKIAASAGLDVSQKTIIRDLKHLENQGLVHLINVQNHNICRGKTTLIKKKETTE